MRRWLTRIGIGLGGLLALALLVVAGLAVASIGRERRTHPLAVAPLAVSPEQASVERGRHLVTAVNACADCHGDDLGGRAVVDEGTMFGRIAATNLTRGRGGIGGARTDADLVRAIRHGIGPDGRSLRFMPTEAYARLSDADIVAIVAYLRAVPPVDREPPPTRVGPIMRAVHVVGGFPLLSAERVAAAPPMAAGAGGAANGDPAAHGDGAPSGEYLATVSGCRSCHGEALAGAHGPNVTSGALGSWTAADFRRLLREGRRPDGTAVSDAMPWRVLGRMSDAEIDAIWTYVRSMPPVAPASPAS